MVDAFLTGTWPGEDLLPFSKAHVLSALSATGRVYNFCGFQKRMVIYTLHIQNSRENKNFTNDEISLSLFVNRVMFSKETLSTVLAD